MCILHKLQKCAAMLDVQCIAHDSREPITLHADTQQQLCKLKIMSQTV
jgi:hypothetical protein